MDPVPTLGRRVPRVLRGGGLRESNRASFASQASSMEHSNRDWAFAGGHLASCPAGPGSASHSQISAAGIDPGESTSSRGSGRARQGFSALSGNLSHRATRHSLRDRRLCSFSERGKRQCPAYAGRRTDALVSGQRGTARGSGSCRDRVRTAVVRAEVGETSTYRLERHPYHGEGQPTLVQNLPWNFLSSESQPRKGNVSLIYWTSTPA